MFSWPPTTPAESGCASPRAGRCRRQAARPACCPGSANRSRRSKPCRRGRKNPRVEKSTLSSAPRSSCGWHGSWLISPLCASRRKGLGQTPVRQRIRREALVERRCAGGQIFALQVRKNLAQAAGRGHGLVRRSSRPTGCDIEKSIVGQQHIAAAAGANSARSKAASPMAAAASTNSCRTRGRDAVPSGPQAASSTGTSRQPRGDVPSSPRHCSSTAAPQQPAAGRSRERTRPAAKRLRRQICQLPARGPATTHPGDTAVFRSHRR